MSEPTGLRAGIRWGRVIGGGLMIELALAVIAVPFFASGQAGAVAMVIVGGIFDGPARLAAIGLAHSGAYLLGLVWLLVELRPSVGAVVGIGQVRPVALAACVALAAWATMTAWSPEGRLTTLLALVAIGCIGGAAYLLGL